MIGQPKLFGGNLEEYIEVCIKFYLQRKFSDSKIYLFGKFGEGLTLKAPITSAADDIHKYFSLFFRENKT